MDPDKHAPSSSNEPNGEGSAPAAHNPAAHDAPGWSVPPAVPDMPAPPMGGTVISPNASAPSEDLPAAVPTPSSAPSQAHAPTPHSTGTSFTGMYDAHHGHADAPAGTTPPAPAPGPSPSPTSASPAPSGASTMDWFDAASPTAVHTGVTKKRKKPLIIGVIIAALIVILLGASATAFYVYNKPQNVLNMALLNSFSDSKVKSVNFEGKLQVKSSDSPAINASFTGAADENGAMDFSGSLDAFVTNVTFDAKTPDGSTYYIRLGGLDGLPQLLSAANVPGADQLGPVVSGLNNQWIEINQSIIQQLTGQSDDINAKLSSGDRSKIVKAYKQHQFLTVTQTLSQDTIKGRASYHYKVKASPVKLKEFAAALRSANLDSIKLTQSQLQSFDSGVDSAHLEKYPFDVWVAKSGRLIDQISLTTTENGGTVTMSFTVDDYNKPVTVTKPAGSKSLLDILSGLAGSGLLPTDASGGTGSTGGALDLGNGISL